MRRDVYSIRTMIFAVLAIFACTHAAMGGPSAQDLLRGRMNTPMLKLEGDITGEGVCWHAAYDMSRFMDEYQKTKDPAFLDAAVTYYEALIGKLHVSPDGYKGWVGPFIYDENYICDVHIGDAILINPMLEFSEIVLRQSPDEIRERYEKQAKQYIELASHDLIEKWDKRGTWHEDGPYGAYVSWDHYLTEDNLAEWRILPVDKSNLSLPFNKQNAMALACLRLYRIGGDEAYRDKALKIFNFMKSRMTHFRDHMVWNYWEPFGPWDVDPGKPNTLRHWVNVHPYRDYQAVEVEQISEAYQSGLTFSKDDLQRIINTNLKVMWNGDRENPQWHNSNFAVETEALGGPSITEAPGGEFPRLAGTLWRGLIDFDETLRELAKAQPALPATFDRKYSDLPVTVFEFPYHDDSHFIMAASLPAAPREDEAVKLVCSTRTPGGVTITLRSSDGDREIQTIRAAKENEPARVLVVDWDHDGVAPGAYRIRWSQGEAYRDFPIEVK
ncbi:MAG: hypothetical protein GC154_06610 [bacterium]|nr:hypothetical protein [bacterium]